MVIGGNGWLRGRKFESRHRILDRSYLHLFVVKLYSYLRKTKNKWKRGEYGHIFYLMEDFEIVQNAEMQKSSIVRFKETVSWITFRVPISKFPMRGENWFGNFSSIPSLSLISHFHSLLPVYLSIYLSIYQSLSLSSNIQMTQVSIYKASLDELIVLSTSCFCFRRLV